MPPSRGIGVVGTGGLARAVCYALAAIGVPGGAAVEVTVVGRDAGRVAQLRSVVNARAALAGTGISFAPGTGLAGVEGVLVCASTTDLRALRTRLRTGRGDH